MMEIDWSKAPEGTTHWDPVDKNHLRQYGKIAQYWNIERGWSEKGWQYPDDLSTMPRLIARPVWDGESIPPVGTVCEMTFDDGKFSWGYWLKTKVLCYGDTMVFVSQETDRKPGEWLEGSIKATGMKFRPIRTPEQIEEQKMIAGLNEMIGHMKDHPSGTHGVSHLQELMIHEDVARDLWAAGYRKQEPKPE